MDLIGFPIYSHFTKRVQSTQGAFNVGGTNATGQVASLPGLVSLIDVETPASAYTKASYMNANDEWDLVFSDEFNLDGRTFYPGDDPFWEATDFHYWGTVRYSTTFLRLCLRLRSELATLLGL